MEHLISDPYSKLQKQSFVHKFNHKVEDIDLLCVEIESAIDYLNQIL